MTNDIINSERKQNISLSRYADKILKLDLSLFQAEDSFAGLVNRILNNYYEAAADSKIFQDFYRLDTKTIKQIYPNDINTKVRLKQETDAVLEYFEDVAYEDFKGKRALFFKAILEDYVRQTTYRREEILFKNLFMKIQKMLQHNEKPYHLHYHSGTGHKYECLLKPYRMSAEYESDAHYLLGMAKSEEEQDFVPRTFRVSRIESIRKSKIGNGKLSSLDRDLIEERCYESGVEFISARNEEIEISLTQYGLELFNSIYSLRPTPQKDKTRQIGDRIHMKFFCTKAQARFYFFKFGSDVEIIRPASLRKEFFDSYIAAANVYSKKRKK